MGVFLRREEGRGGEASFSFLPLRAAWSVGRGGPDKFRKEMGARFKLHWRVVGCGKPGARNII